MAALGAALGAMLGLALLLLVQHVPCWLTGHRPTAGGWCARCLSVPNR